MYSLFRAIELIARGIAFTPGAIWITGCDRNDCGITRIDARNDQIVTTIRTAKAPFGIASVESAVWVTNPGENSVSRINPATNQIVATIPVGEVPTAIAVGEGAVWVINTRNKSVSRIDPQTNAVIATIRISGSPQGIAVGNGAVWVTSIEASVSRIDPATNTVVKKIGTSKHGTRGAPRDIIVQDGNIWITAGWHVLRIDATSNKIVEWIRIPLKHFFALPEDMRQSNLWGLAFLDGLVWVADSEQNSLWKIDIHTNKIIREPVPVGFSPQILAPGNDGDGVLWVCNRSNGSVMKIKP